MEIKLRIKGKATVSNDDASGRKGKNEEIQREQICQTLLLKRASSDVIAAEYYLK